MATNLKIYKTIFSFYLKQLQDLYFYNIKGRANFDRKTKQLQATLGFSFISTERLLTSLSLYFNIQVSQKTQVYIQHNKHTLIFCWMCLRASAVPMSPSSWMQTTSNFIFTSSFILESVLIIFCTSLVVITITSWKHNSHKMY